MKITEETADAIVIHVGSASSDVDLKIDCRRSYPDAEDSNFLVSLRVYEDETMKLLFSLEEVSNYLSSAFTHYYPSCIGFAGRPQWIGEQREWCLITEEEVAELNEGIEVVRISDILQKLADHIERVPNAPAASSISPP